MDAVIMSPYSYVMPHMSQENAVLKVFPITVSKIRDKRIGSTHWHDYLQIWYTVSGEYSHTVNGVTYTQKPGDAMLVFPYMIHSIDASNSDLETLQVYEISIRKDLFEKHCIPFLSHSYMSASFDSFYLSPNVHLDNANKERADILCSELASEYDKRFAMHTTKMVSKIACLLELFIKNCNRTASKRELAAIRAKHEYLDSAIGFIVDNSSKKITLDDISSAAMTSRSVLALNFNETVGQTCHNYITSLRVYYSLNLLRRTKKTLSEIAEECGFCDASHLTRSYIKAFGESPLVVRREFRKLAQENGEYLFNLYKRENGWLIDYDGKLLDMYNCSMSFY